MDIALRGTASTTGTGTGESLRVLRALGVLLSLRGPGLAVQRHIITSFMYAMFYSNGK